MLRLLCTSLKLKTFSIAGASRSQGRMSAAAILAAASFWAAGIIGIGHNRLVVLVECLLKPYVQRFQAGDFTRAKISETSFTSSANLYLKPESPRPQGASRQVPRPIFQKLSDSAAKVFQLCLFLQVVQVLPPVPPKPSQTPSSLGWRFEMVLLSRLCTSSMIQLSEVKLHSFTTCRQELIMDSYGSDRINLFWWNVSRLQPGRRNHMLGWGSTCRLRSHMSCTMPFSLVKSLCSGSYPALYSRHGDSTELTVA